jgi:hypothetical protein
MRDAQEKHFRYEDVAGAAGKIVAELINYGREYHDEGGLDLASPVPAH